MSKSKKVAPHPALVANIAKVLSGETSDNDVFREPERKFVFEAPASALLQFNARTEREAYRSVFARACRSHRLFPSLSSVFGGRARSVTRKGLRRRIHYADFTFVKKTGEVISRLLDATIEIRLDQNESELAIKKGNGASADHRTMDRIEAQKKVLIPHFGAVSDIETNATGTKKLYGEIAKLFHKGDSRALYPAVISLSDRGKFVYLRKVSFEGNDYILPMEFAQDEGKAVPTGAEDQTYDIDQIEVEVKGVFCVKTGMNVLKNYKKADMSLDDVKTHLIEPVLDHEERLLKARYGLVPMYDSKPKQGYEAARRAFATEKGRAAMEAARKDHLKTTIWTRVAKALKYV